MVKLLSLYFDQRKLNEQSEDQINADFILTQGESTTIYFSKAFNQTFQKDVLKKGRKKRLDIADQWMLLYDNVLGHITLFVA